MYNGKTRSSRADKFDRIDGGAPGPPEGGEGARSGPPRCLRRRRQAGKVAGAASALIARAMHRGPTSFPPI